MGEFFGRPHVAERAAPGLAGDMESSIESHPGVEPSRRGRYTDVRGIAEHLAITERHVRRLVLERRIPHRKVGSRLRFDIAEVDAWMDTLRRGPVPEHTRAARREPRRSRTA